MKLPHPKSRVARVLASVAAVVLVGNLLLASGSSLIGGSQPGGSDGSSYATQEAGLAAWAELLKRSGHRVEGIGGRPDRVALPKSATLVFATDDSIDSSDWVAAAGHLERGGRVVALGDAAFELLGVQPVGFAGHSGRTSFALQPGASETAELRTVDVAPGMVFRSDAGGQVLAGDGMQLLSLAVTSHGGRLIAIANMSIFDNGHLARADNAAFSLQVVGDGPVYFVEGLHGYGTSSGWSALPGRTRQALLVLFAAVLVGIWSLGKRFGPIEDVKRKLLPPRSGYVEALAAGMLRGHDPRAVTRPLQDDVRRRLRRRTGMTGSATDEELAAAASATGVPADVVLRALAVPDDDSHLKVVCDAVAQILEQEQTIG